MKLPPLYSRRSDGKLQIWEKEVEDNRHRTLSGILDGKIVVSEWFVCEGKNAGRSNATTPQEQALVEAKAEWKKKKDKGYHENKDSVDNTQFFEPMLAKVWEDYKDDVTLPLYVQPKLDGLRLIASKRGLFSRNGKEYKSIPHIYNSLHHLFQENSGYIFDGEIYADKFNNDFNAICSLAKKTKPTSQDLVDSAASIEYHVYDLPSNKGKFSERYGELSEIEFGGSIKVVRTNKVKKLEEVDTYYGEFVELGYEGLMVRVDAHYENKRTKNLLKYKAFQDGEFLIIDVVEGNGNKSGTAGALVCKKDNGQVFNSNVKGSREHCAKILKDKHLYIGKMATIQYFNLTTDGIPRFPYFLRLREEE